MDLGQLFEILPTELESRLSDREWWLTSAAYQHSWIGIYAQPVDVSIPEWQADELNVLANALRNGAARFRALTYSAD
jgi:hypothetical protein